MDMYIVPLPQVVQIMKSQPYTRENNNALLDQSLNKKSVIFIALVTMRETDADVF